MKIAINTGYVKKVHKSELIRNDYEAALLCKEAGFDVVDCSPSFYLEDDWKEQALRLAEQFAESGIVVEQSHAPYNRYKREDEESLKEKLGRSLLLYRRRGDYDNR